MRPVSAVYEISQPFGSMKTQGVAASNIPDTVGWYVKQYGNYQPYGHAGCDIACPEGTPVHAIAAGTVLWADWGTNLPGDETNAGYRRRWYLYKSFPGIVTVIQHAGWIGVYAHLSAAHMNAGDTVTEAQQIGLSGGTGGVSPHLHVEALVDLNYTTGGGLIYGRTDPEPYFAYTGIAPQGSITADAIITKLEEAGMALDLSDRQFIQEVVNGANNTAIADNRAQAEHWARQVIESIKDGNYQVKVFTQNVVNPRIDEVITDNRALHEAP